MFRLGKQLRFALATSVVTLLSAGYATAQGRTAQAQQKPQRHEAAPQVTAVSLRPVKFRVGQTCPANPTLYGAIRTNGATTVKYSWLSSGGKRRSPREIKFTAAGLQTVTTNWKLGVPGEKVDEWIQFETLAPNPMTSQKVDLRFTCTGTPSRSKK